jgi:plastocyanin
VLKHSAIGAVAFAVATAALAACNSSNTTSAPMPRPTTKPSSTPSASPSPSPTPSPTPTAQPQVVHIGFELNDAPSSFGTVSYYSPTVTPPKAAIVTVKAGSRLVFLNDGGSHGATPSPHTASGLGTSGFPPHFDNTSGMTQSGTTIDSSLTWSTGTLSDGPSSFSQVFTVGPPGNYFFGCAFHFDSDNMRDVIVSQ